MSVRHVLAQANVTHQDELWDLVLDGPGGPLHNPVLFPGASCDFVLLLRQTEQNDSRDTQRMSFLGFFHCLVDRKVEHSRHRAHFFANTLAWTDEQRIYEIFRG